MRTKAQREQEFLAKKAAMVEKLQGIQSGLEDTHQTLQHRFYPSEQRFKEWALEAHAKDANRAINIKEFMRDFCMEVARGLGKHHDDLRYATTAVKEWEEWFDGIEEEDLGVLEGQMEQAGISLSAIQAI